MKHRPIRLFALGLALLAVFACGKNGSEQRASSAPAAQQSGPPAPVQQPLVGSPRPSLLLTQAWFWTDASGKQSPGPARLEIWRKDDQGKWTATRLEDSDSNVFHKALPFQDGLLTIGAEGAFLKFWRHPGGKWAAETWWHPHWSGRFNRLRDLEIGDVDGDGKPELVIATHDAGVVGVVDPPENGAPAKATELDEKPDTFVHEIEICDIDGDGKLEFFATPSERNQANASQAGGVVMYKFDGQKYVRTWVDHQEGTHAKEILCQDMDGDGKAELYSSLEAEIDPNDNTKMVKPVEIRQYHLQADGTFTHEPIANIQDRQNRFLVAADFDHDGKLEMIAAAMKTGIYYLTPPAGGQGKWLVTSIDRDSSGFEHACNVADLDGDGTPEIYVAADDQHELRRYTYAGGKFTREVIGPLDANVITWNVTAATL